MSDYMDLCFRTLRENIAQVDANTKEIADINRAMQALLNRLNALETDGQVETAEPERCKPAPEFKVGRPVEVKDHLQFRLFGIIERKDCDGVGWYAVRLANGECRRMHSNSLRPIDVEGE